MSNHLPPSPASPSPAPSPQSLPILPLFLRCLRIHVSLQPYVLHINPHLFIASFSRRFLRSHISCHRYVMSLFFIFFLFIFFSYHLAFYSVACKYTKSHIGLVTFLPPSCPQPIRLYIRLSVCCYGLLFVATSRSSCTARAPINIISEAIPGNSGRSADHVSH